MGKHHGSSSSSSSSSNSSSSSSSSPKQESKVLFPGTLPLASAGVGGYWLLATGWVLPSYSLTRSPLRSRGRRIWEESSQLTFIFFKMVKTTNQHYISIFRIITHQHSTIEVTKGFNSSPTWRLVFEPPPLRLKRFRSIGRPSRISTANSSPSGSLGPRMLGPTGYPLVNV